MCFVHPHPCDACFVVSQRNHYTYTKNGAFEMDKRFPLSSFGSISLHSESKKEISQK